MAQKCKIFSVYALFLKRQCFAPFDLWGFELFLKYNFIHDMLFKTQWQIRVQEG